MTDDDILIEENPTPPVEGSPMPEVKTDPVPDDDDEPEAGIAENGGDAA